MTRARPASEKRLALPQVMSDGQVAAAAWFGLVRAHAMITRRLERELDAFALSLPQFEVLAILHHNEGITQQELAQKLLVTKGNICMIVDRMERDGLVQRRADLDDRRMNRLFLRDTGRRRFEAAFARHQKLVREIMSRFTPGERKTLMQLMTRLNEPCSPG